MLEELTIRDFALADRLQLRFGPGLQLLSGETGAGKSILIGALSFVLGGKADAEVIRAGAEECLVSAVFSIGPEGGAAAWLEARGMAAEDGTVVLRRSLRQGGRGTAYIQSAPVSRADLQDFTAFLVDVHGQHEHQSLIKEERHRAYLDRFAGIEGEVAEYARVFNELCEKKKGLEAMLASETDRERRIDYLEFAVGELEAAKLKPGEEEELTAEEKRLSQYGRLFEQAEAAGQALSGGAESHEGAALTRLKAARVALEAAASIDPDLADLARRLDEAYYELADLGQSLNSYIERSSFSPDRLDQVGARLAELFRLKKKYGPSVDEVMQAQHEMAAELERLRDFDAESGGLKADIGRLEREGYQRALELSAKRSKAAGSLAGRVESTIRDLGMPKAEFKVSLAKKGSEGRTVIGPFGIDNVEFQIAPNPGEGLKPLAKIASGGELSRVMLALKTALAESDEIATLVFDEIDTGIGGEVAVAVGDHLAALAAHKQVFCITHLATIAVRADNHMKVEKLEEAGRSLSRVFAVQGTEREQEIARMLSGSAGGEQSLRHARELLREAKGRLL